MMVSQPSTLHSSRADVVLIIMAATTKMKRRYAQDPTLPPDFASATPAWCRVAASWLDVLVWFQRHRHLLVSRLLWSRFRVRRTSSFRVTASDDLWPSLTNWGTAIGSRYFPSSISTAKVFTFSLCDISNNYQQWERGKSSVLRQLSIVGKISDRNSRCRLFDRACDLTLLQKAFWSSRRS